MWGTLFKQKWIGVGILYRQSMAGKIWKDTKRFKKFPEVKMLKILNMFDFIYHALKVDKVWNKMKIYQISSLKLLVYHNFGKS